MEGRAWGLQDGQLGGGDRGAGPAAGDRALGGAAAARAVVDVPDQLAAQGRAEDQPAVAGEVGHARTAARVDHGEGRARALDLAGGGGEELPRGGGLHAEDGGDLVDGQVVADGEFQGLALLGGGTGGLGPGQQGEFTAPPLLDLGGGGPGRRVRDRCPGALAESAPDALAGSESGSGSRRGRLPAAPARSGTARSRPGTARRGSGAARRVGGLTFLLGLGQLPQARPAGQGVQPGPAVGGGRRGPVAAPLGQGEGVTEGGGGRVVVAQDRQTVGEQAVQVRLVARRRLLGDGARGGAIARLRRLSCLTGVTPCCTGLRGLVVRPMRARRAGRGLRTAAHHPCDRRRPWSAPSGTLSTFNPYG